MRRIDEQQSARLQKKEALERVADGIGQVQRVRSEGMKRSLGSQLNNAARDVNGTRPADPNDTNSTFTSWSGYCTNRILWRSNGRHVHTRLG